MYDAGKIIPGLLIFLVLVTFPLWYQVAVGGGSGPPEPKIVTQEKQCVAPAEYMKASHMDLLNQWRDEVVRRGDRVYTAFNGKKYNKSLSGTCLNCHSNMSEFCDACHNYGGITPYCWDCHVEPQEVQ